jgi:serine/threonine-protein kinase
VVHRDVSPQNVLISFEGAVKLIDFGVARALGRLTETRAGGVKGKIQYMSPEQVMGGRVDRRSDVFALGIVLWEALCGRRLFRRENEPATLRAILEEPILRPSEVVSISPPLERIVMRALEKEPGDRFKTAEEMALALSRHAFATDGFNPLQIGTAMKALFASDHERWRRTVAAARQLEGAPEKWNNTGGTFLRPRSIDLRTQGATVVLRGGTSGPTTLVEGSSEGQSGSRSASTGFSLPAAPRGRHRRWLGGIGMAIVAIVLAIFVHSPSVPLITAAAVRRVPAVIVEPLKPPPAPRSAGEPAEEAPGGAPAPPLATRVPKPDVRRKASSPRLPATRVKPGAARQGPQGHVVSSAAKPASNSACSVTLGTRPWSEVWIDGRKTRRHTPYTATLGCGRHTLTFKRNDLRLTKTFPVFLYPGEPLKQSFSLSE